MCFLTDSVKYFEVNENEKTVYYDCLNEPRCLVAARLYKQTKSLKMFGNHSECCPPDSKMKIKIHFEEFLKKDVHANENAPISVLNIYKRAINDRYAGIWLPINHRSDFLPVLRRLQAYHKAKPNNSQAVKSKKKDAVTSPIQVGDEISHTENLRSKSPNLLDAGTSSMATTSHAENVVENSNDMGFSPMHTSPQNQSTPANNGSSVEDQMNESLVAVQHINIRVASNGDSTISVVASSSLSTAESHINSQVYIYICFIGNFSTHRLNFANDLCYDTFLVCRQTNSTSG